MTTSHTVMIIAKIASICNGSREQKMRCQIHSHMIITYLLILLPIYFLLLSLISSQMGYIHQTHSKRNHLMADLLAAEANRKAHAVTKATTEEQLIGHGITTQSTVTPLASVTSFLVPYLMKTALFLGCFAQAMQEARFSKT